MTYAFTAIAALGGLLVVVLAILAALWREIRQRDAAERRRAMAVRCQALVAEGAGRHGKKAARRHRLS